MAFLSQSAAQQPSPARGYYLNHQRDTLYGTFEFHSLGEQVVYFTAVGSDKREALHPEAVMQIVAEPDVDILVRRRTRNEVVHYFFIHRVLAGPVNLYTGKSPLEGDQYFINSFKDTTIRQVPAREPRRFLRLYFPECNREDIQAKYQLESIRRAIWSYLDCIAPGQQMTGIQENPSINKLRVGIGLKGVIAYEQSEISGWMAGDFEPQLNPGLGIDLRLGMARTALDIGIFYNKRQFVQNDSIIGRLLYDPTSYINFRQVTYPAPFHFEYDVLSIPIGIVHRFRERKSGLAGLVTAGAAVQFINNPRMKAEPRSYLVDLFDRKEVYMPVENYPDFLPASFKPLNTSASFFIGAGLHRKIGERSDLEMILKYVVVSESLLTPGPNSQISVRRIELAAVYHFEFSR